MSEEKIVQIIYVYKCRMCGKEYDDGTPGPYAYMRANFSHLIITGEPLRNKELIGDGMQPTMIEAHACGNKQTGVADLIGIRETNNF